MLSCYLRKLIFNPMQTIINKIKKYKVLLYRLLGPFRGVLFFIFLFIVFDFFWKLTVHFGEGNDESVLLFLGKDLTSYTDAACIWTAKATHWLVHDLLGYENFHRQGSTIFFDNSIPLNVIWSCLGLKQFFLFLFIMCLYYGPWKHKKWYIPMSLLILIIVNILRQSIISIIMKDPFPEWFIPFNEWREGLTWENTSQNYWRFYLDWFHLLHRDIFTWLYYDGIIFVLWLIWEEKFNKPYQRLKNKVTR